MWLMANQLIGNLIDRAGTFLGLPERGWSERVAGGNTVNTGSTPFADSFFQPRLITPETNRSVAQNVLARSGVNVLGATTENNPTQRDPNLRMDPIVTGGGSSGGGFNMNNYAGWGEAEARADYEARQQQDPYAGLRNDISSGWDSYINSLNDQLSGLDSQRLSQEQIAQSQYQQGVNTLGQQRDEGLTQLGNQRQEATANQSRTLRDLAGNIRNSLQAGNVYLGARGAGDSSASNQYAYALTRLGTQQRSDVMNQTSKIMADIGQRESQLNSIYNTETNNLKLELDQAMSGIASWFADAQNQLKQLQASGQLSKSQDLQNLSRDILNQAISQMNQLQQYSIQKRQALDQWAMGVSENVNQLRTNMQSVQQFAPELPGFTPIAGTPTVDSSGNFRVPTGYGGFGSDEKRQRGLFG